MHYFISLFTIEFVLFYLMSKTKNSDKKLILLFMSISIIVLFQGFRDYSVGIDLDKKGGYLPFFHYVSLTDVISTSGYKFEKGFVTLSFLIKSINYNFTFYLMMISLCIQFPIIYIIYKESNSGYLSIIMYLCLGLFTFSFSGLRQSVALGLLTLSFLQIKDRNLFKFICIVLLATTFHTSSIVFLPAYYVYVFDSSSKRSFFNMGLFLMVILIFRKLILNITNIILRRNLVLENNGSFRMVLILFTLWILSWILSKYRIKSKLQWPLLSFEKNSKKFKEIVSFSNFTYVALIFQIFAMEITSLSRMGYYYYIYSILLVPLLIDKICSRKIKVFAMAILIIGCVIYFNFQTGSGYLNVIPFKFKS